MKLLKAHTRLMKSEILESAILATLYKKIYEDILDIIKCLREIQNSDLSAVEQALNKGVIQYTKNYFYGHFSSQISAELLNLGAVFDKRLKAFKIEFSALPIEIQHNITVNNKVYKDLHEHIVDYLNQLEPEKLFNSLAFDDEIEDIILQADSSFKDTVKAYFTIVPEFTPEMARNLARDYSHNLKLNIKKFSSSEILSLRNRVEINARNGYRSTTLENIVKKSLKVSENKARFLARQETSLFMSKYREQRYTTLGIKSYKWSTSKDSRVRDDHDYLDGEVFSWTSPPIIDRRTGKRGHPGEDYNCRCIAIPVIEDYYV